MRVLVLGTGAIGGLVAASLIDAGADLALLERVGHHKTSMLQDLEAGQPLEIDALLGSVIDRGELVGAPVDTLRAERELTMAIDPGRRVTSLSDSMQHPQVM